MVHIIVIVRNYKILPIISTAEVLALASAAEASEIASATEASEIALTASERVTLQNYVGEGLMSTNPDGSNVPFL